MTSDEMDALGLPLANQNLRDLVYIPPEYWNVIGCDALLVQVQRCSTSEVGRKTFVASIMWSVQRLLKKMPSIPIEITLDNKKCFAKSVPSDVSLEILQYLSPAEIDRHLRESLKIWLPTGLNGRRMWYFLCSSKPWGLVEEFDSNMDYSELYHKFVTTSERVDNGTVHEVESTLRVFESICMLQTKALNRLADLVQDERQRREAGVRGVVPRVISAMKKFSNDAELQKRGCLALVKLGRPLGSSEGSVFSLRMGAASGINQLDMRGAMEMVLVAMKLHHDRADVQSAACWCLVNLCLKPENIERLLQLEALNLVHIAMKRHTGNEELQFRALFCLVNMIAPSVRHSTEDDVPPTEIINLVLAAMRRYHGHTQLLRRGCLVLKNIAIPGNVAVQQSLMAEGATAALAEVVNRLSMPPPQGPGEPHQQRELSTEEEALLRAARLAQDTIQMAAAGGGMGGDGAGGGGFRPLGRRQTVH